MTLGAAASVLVMMVFTGTFYMVMDIRDGNWALSSYIENPEKNRLLELLHGVGVKGFQELSFFDLTENFPEPGFIIRKWRI